MRASGQEVELIRNGIAAIAAEPRAAGRVFYAELFARAPGLRPLFVGDMDRQAEKLVATLAALGSQAGAWVELAPEAEALGLRHIAYGVRAEDYAPVGAALVAMLRARLGPGWTPEAEAAWSRLYAALAAQMIAAG